MISNTSIAIGLLTMFSKMMFASMESTAFKAGSNHAID